MNIIFNKIIIIDRNEKKATIQEFKEGINLITSKKTDGKGNYCGKSTILRSLYHSLGADCDFDNQKGWETDDKYYYILQFSKDDERFSIIRHDRYFAIYDSNKKVFDTFNRDELYEFYTNFFNFNVLLKESTPERKYVKSKPFALFCFDFLDQKHLSGCSFSSFNSMTEYSDIYTDIIYAHLGINNKEVNDIIEVINDKESTLKENNRNEEILGKIVSSIEESKDLSNFIDDMDTLKKQLIMHKEEYDSLISNANILKEKLFSLYESKSVIEQYIKKLATGIKEAKQDDKILTTHECPLCKNKVDNYISIYLKKVNTDDELSYQLLESKEELNSINRKIDLAVGQYKGFEDRIEKIEALICNQNTGLEQTIQGIGIKKYKSTIVDKLSMLLFEDKQLGDSIKDEKKKLKNFEARIKELNQDYYGIFSNILNKHDIKVITLPNEKLCLSDKLKCNDNHVLSVVWLCALNQLKAKSNPNGTFFPMVFDNPTDRDFDKEYSKTILQTIFDCSSFSKQIIVSKVEINENDFSEYKISNHINLDNSQFLLLGTEKYEEAFETLKRLSKLM